MSQWSSQQFRDLAFEQFARIGKAISSPKRLELLDLLEYAERTVEVIAQEAGLSVANASRHLQVLRAAGLVEAEKRGLYVSYRIADPEVIEFLASLRALSEKRLSDLTQITTRFLRGAEGMDKVSAEHLFAKIKNDSVTLLDVRPVEEFREAHLPKAISVPVKQLEQYLTQLPQAKQIVAYCRGRYCVLATEAVQQLRSLGYQAATLEGGIQGWQEQGYRVESGQRAGKSAGRTVHR